MVQISLEDTMLNGCFATYCAFLTINPTQFHRHSSLKMSYHCKRISLWFLYLMNVFV